VGVSVNASGGAVVTRADAQGHLDALGQRPLRVQVLRHRTTREVQSVVAQWHDLAEVQPTEREALRLLVVRALSRAGLPVPAGVSVAGPQRPQPALPGVR
jgi:hypothetical protein